MTAVVALLVVAMTFIVPVTPASAGHDFVDVGADHVFHGEVSWLAERGITEGYADGSFRPGREVTRQEAAAFLHRLEGEPASPTGAADFSDVGQAHLFAAPIAWMAGAGITEGYGDGTFRPTWPVSRQAMAAFMYRAVVEQALMPAV